VFGRGEAKALPDPFRQFAPETAGSTWSPASRGVLLP